MMNHAGSPQPRIFAKIPQRGFEMLANTVQFDCTHHPAMSLPCGLWTAFDEETIYRAAAAFESGVDWKGRRAG
jgi:amidase